MYDKNNAMKNHINLLTKIVVKKYFLREFPQLAVTTEF